MPNIATKPFAETWCEFVDTWERVKFAKGQGLMRDILNRAMKQRPPAAAKQYDSEPIRLLVAICYQLHRAAEGGSFFLATRTAAELIGVQPRDISAWLKGLAADGVIECVSKGQAAGRKASEFKFIGE